jgi:heptaprenyl diphosphate synthase
MNPKQETCPAGHRQLAITGQFLSPTDLRIANELLAWAEQYLTRENPNINRPRGSQTVCPFVRGSIKSNHFYMVFHPEIDGASERHIEHIMIAYMDDFLAAPPVDPESQLTKSLLVVFPRIPHTRIHVLDAVHKQIKTRFVQRQLMVSQFHKKCDERCVYNDAFKVNLSPYPLMAMRHMSVHDILFLGEDATWFKEYDARFGHRFRNPERMEEHNKHLVDFYSRARARFGA